MSGGVDSSVAALLLKQQGYEVIGISMKLSDMPENPSVKTSGCCSVKDFNDARSVCDALGIPFYAMNFKEEFKEKVMNTFVSEYLKGRTPNPCVLCNQEIKFNTFLIKASELGAEFVATGHYARVERDEQTGQFQLLKGKDPQKDQSYFLFSLRKEELPRILFPVGMMTKSEVREIARSHHLKTKDKPESQEICFVPNDDHGRFIESFAPNQVSSGGEFVDDQGQVLGHHPGIHHFTIGQRRGTQVSVGRRFYVKQIDPVTNRITLSEDKELYHERLVASSVSWIGDPPSENQTVTAKIRYRHEGALCQVSGLGSDQVEVRFETSQRAITPGQAVVFYLGDEVLGGGWIEH
jgi:tRNA-specific 2-thiouridylase